MTKDYASRSNKKKSNKKKSQKKSRQHTQQRKSLPGWIWLLIGLALGGLITLTYVMFSNLTNRDSLTSQELNIEAPRESIKESDTVVTAIETNTTTVSDIEAGSQNKLKKTDFAFYTLLPEQEVLVQNRRKTRPSNISTKKREGKKKQDALRKGKYIFQAGSFQGKADAQKLNQRIKSKGLASTIEEGTLKQNDKSVTWHRVIVGPFNGNAQIEKAENTLRALGITPLLLKRN